MNVSFLYLFRVIGLTLCVVLVGEFSMLASDSITATVHNLTTGKPSSGDDVFLVIPAKGMQQVSNARTDAQGSFTLAISSSGGRYIIRVVHQGINYDYVWNGGAVPEINVFDVAPRVSGLKGYATMLKIESEGTGYRVTEMHAIVNESRPPQTQASPGNLELQLPEDAQIDSIIAVGPEGVPVKITLPVMGKELGHYVTSFPLHPGMTRYVCRYRLPPRQTAVFQPWLSYDTKQLSIVFPKSMHFTPVSTRRFHQIIDQNGVQVQVINNVKAGKAPEFALSGTGALPMLRSAIAAHKGLPATVPQGRIAKTDKVPASPARAKPSDTLLVLLAGFLVIVGTAVFVRRHIRISRSEMTRGTLKEKLFQLESAHIQGDVSAEEYVASREILSRKLEQVLPWQS